jgi:hypothetical protein
VLTNFLARRVAKVAGRPPRPSDDLKGLARLAAELYTGSISPHALRAAVHDDVPAARLNAIRSVLEPSSRRPSTVARFLAAADLEPTPLPSPSPRKFAERKQHRSWSIWRLVLPMAAVAAIGSLFAAYHGGVSVSAQELTERGLDALRAVAARVAPEAPAGGGAPESSIPVVPEAESTAEVQSAPPQAENPEPEPAPEPLEGEAQAVAAAAPPDPRPLHSASAVAPVAENAPHTAAALPPSDPPVVSLGVARIAAREDHSVVAIDVMRSGDTTQEASVSWWTTPDTADVEDDYADVGRQTLPFPAGSTVARVLIPIVNDGVRESAEAFTVHLSRPRGAVAGAIMETRVTLHDDD